MEIDKKDAFRNHIQEASEIMFIAHSSLKIVEYLAIRISPKGRALAARNLFLDYSLKTNWRIAVIELCKLLANRRNEDFNLYKIFNSLKIDGEYHELGINEEVVSKWESWLKRHSKLIDNLLKQRDKVYAHKDSDYKTVVNELSWKDANELLMTVQDIIQSLYGLAFESHLSLTMLDEPVDDLHILIKSLIKLDEAYAEDEAKLL